MKKYNLMILLFAIFISGCSPTRQAPEINTESEANETVASQSQTETELSESLESVTETEAVQSTDEMPVKVMETVCML